MLRIISIAALLFLVCGVTFAQDTTPTRTNLIYSIPVESMTNTSATVTGITTLAPYKGKVLLIVNVASKCGFTPQYAGLEQLYRKYKAQGFEILAFPSNDFGSQEPGSEQEIVTFCRSRYDVTFPMFAKLHAKGPEIAPLYKHLVASGVGKPGDVAWNFEKFLVNRNGQVVGRFASKVKPDDPQLVQSIEKELGASITKP